LTWPIKVVFRSEGSVIDGLLGKGA
jgi:hypothetical protein